MSKTVKIALVGVVLIVALATVMLDSSHQLSFSEGGSNYSEAANWKKLSESEIEIALPTCGVMKLDKITQKRNSVMVQLQGSGMCLAVVSPKDIKRSVIVHGAEHLEKVEVYYSEAEKPQLLPNFPAPK